MRGLSRSDVAERVARGESNDAKQQTSRPLWLIIRDNVFTLFNAVLTACFIVIAFIGDLRDAFFFLVVVINAAIGIVQELRAKFALDRLALLSSPGVAVRRDDETVVIDRTHVVLDDIIVLRPGDQLVADGKVLEANDLSVDESHLTGESEPVSKSIGDSLLSGSIIVTGTGFAIVTAVGANSYASKLSEEIRRHSLTSSELRRATNRILVYISWLLGPITLIVLLGRAMTYAGTFNPVVLFTDGLWGKALLDVVASLVGMIPEGLVLLISLAFGVAALTLARQRVLVNELAAVEVLARVDVLAIDKTGTLTSGEVSFRETVELSSVSGWEDALAAFGADDAANITAKALRLPFPSRGTSAIARLPFGSSHAYSGVQIEPGYSWLLGAPERLLAHHAAQRQLAAEFAAKGQRTLALVRLDGPLPADREIDPATLASTPVRIILFGESVREGAAETLRYFETQNVRVLVLSGDNPTTVLAIAAGLGLGSSAVDSRELDGDASLREALDRHSIFGRVTPEQKRAIVRVLQEDGHTVAMTGDGVNDAMAIKDADLGIAMGSGTAAAKAVSRIVLLDDRLDALPDVLAYGRRVIANVERVANLFLAKTVYGVLFAIVFGLLLLPFPFLPRQLTLISSLTIGIPAFLLALAPNARIYHPGILKRLLRYAIPTGAIAAAATGTTYAIVRTIVPLQEARSITTLCLFIVASWILGVLARPLNWARTLLLVAMAVLFVLAVTVPFGRDFFSMNLLWGPAVVVAIVSGLVGAAAIEFTYRFAKRRGLIFDREPPRPVLHLS